MKQAYAHECVDKCSENQHIRWRMHGVRGFLIFLVGTATLSAWDDEPRGAIEVGYATGVLRDGVERARAGVYSRADFAQNGWRGALALHEPFRGAEPRIVQLSAAHEWRVGEEFSIGVTAEHFRQEQAPLNSLRHATRVGALVQWQPLGGWATELSYQRDLRLRANVSEIRLARSFALTRLGAFLEWNAFAGWLDAADARPAAPGVAIRDSFGYAGMAARLPYRVGERTLIVVAAELATTTGQATFWSPLGHRPHTRATVQFAITFEL
ncbi:MAG: hypothetical protein Q8M02_11260 [Candidatus Didemnitutus sp.]|nr:hypothetical protein [Candidatus Didemnitutus sp.]